jgi:GMP synthase (glutamine-hydrolysing)
MFICDLPVNKGNWLFDSVIFGMQVLKHPKILIVLHQEASTPGRIGMMLQAMGFALDIRRPCLGDRLPDTMAEHEGAVIFGGPMSANDNEPWIAHEIEWIGMPLKEQKPFLGVCLGAQMLSMHLGGKVGPHKEERVEIGYYPIHPVNGGDGIKDWPKQVYQWHRESLSLPKDAKLFARGDHFENQAYRYGPSAYGIQFHPEVTRLTMHRWVVKAAHRFSLPDAQGAQDHLNGNLVHDAAVKNWLSQFLMRWLVQSAKMKHNSTELVEATQ